MFIMFLTKVKATFLLSYADELTIYPFAIIDLLKSQGPSYKTVQRSDWLYDDLIATKYFCQFQIS